MKIQKEIKKERSLYEWILFVRECIKNGIRITFIASMILCIWMSTYKPIPQVEASQEQVRTITEDFESKDIPKQPETIEEKIIRFFGKDSEQAIKVFTCESGLNPNVIGDINTKYPSVGVAQIRMLPERNLQVSEMLDADKNLDYAKHLFDKSGWTPWTCRKVL